jgi:hypothetical protein
MAANAKRYWLITGWSSTKKLCEIKKPFGLFTDKGMAALLRTLTAKYALPDSEIVGCYAKAGTKLHLNLLQVEWDGRSGMLSCGHNPHFVAQVVPYVAAKVKG